MMQTRIKVYDRLGAERGILPNPLETMTTLALNDLGTMSLHYDLGSPKSSYLDDDPEIALEALIGGAWVEIPNTRCRNLTVDFDHLEEVPTRRYDFIGVGEALKGVLLYGTYGLPLTDENKVQFTDTNVGRLISTVWNNAVTRGWTGFNYSFTSTNDSNGVPWADTFSISYGVEANLLNILQNLVAQGTADYEWEGRTLHLYNAHTVLARDLTLGANPVRFAGSGNSSGIDAAPELIDQGQLATHVVVLGEKGLRWEFPTLTIVPEVRREVIVSYSGVDDEATARLLADPLILKAQNHLKNTTRQFHLTSDTKHWPFRDFMIGDWANVQRGIVFERMRIFSLNIQVNQHGIQGYVMLGDRIDDLLQKMYQKIQGLSGGMLNEGGTPPAPSDRQPSTPTGLNATASSWVNEDGSTVGGIALNWAHDGKDVVGETIEIKEYLAYYREQGTVPWTLMYTTNGMSGFYGPIPVYKQNGDLAAYDVTVVAVSTKDRSSVQAVPVAITMIEDTSPPPMPSPPEVSTWLRTTRVYWDGLGKNGAVTVNMPPDLDYVSVWEATSADMVGKVRVGTLRSSGALQMGLKTANVTLWYALSATDRTGNESALTASVSITPGNNVDLADITQQVDGAMITNDTIGALKIVASESMWTKVLGAHKILAGEIEANAVETDHLKAGAVTAAKLEAELALVTKIIAGNPNGTHAEMDATGFRVFAEDLVDGIPNEVVRMGVASTDDYFAVTNSLGQLVAAISSAGLGSFEALTARNTFTYKGNELQSILDAMPRGPLYKAHLSGDQIDNITTTYGLTEAQYVIEGDRQILLQVGIKTYPTLANTELYMNIHYTADGSVPNVGSPQMLASVPLGFLSAETFDFKQFSHSFRSTDYFSHLTPPLEGKTIRLLLSVYKGNGNTISVMSGLQTYFYLTDMGKGIPYVPNHNPGGGSNPTPQPAVPAQQTYVSQWGCTNSANYDGSGNRYTNNDSVMYQGLSPAGYGNLKSIGLFNDMTATLSGATINYVRVYFNFQHWYNNNGGTARIGVHGHTSIPATDTGRGPLSVISTGWPKPGARWVELSSSHWEGFKSGIYKGVFLEGDSTYETYGYAERPVIEISYTK